MDKQVNGIACTIQFAFVTRGQISYLRTDIQIAVVAKARVDPAMGSCVLPVHLPRAVIVAATWVIEALTLSSLRRWVQAISRCVKQSEFLSWDLHQRVNMLARQPAHNEILDKATRAAIPLNGASLR